MPKVKKDYPSKKLEENLQWGRQAISHVNRVLPYGPANKENESLSVWWGEYDYLVHVLRRIYLSQRDPSPLNDTSKQQRFAKKNLSFNALQDIFFFKAKLLESGNCQEQTLIASKYLEEKGVNPVELFYMYEGNHVFLVIGRNPSTSPFDPHSWNSDAVICDPWSGEVYSAQEFLYGFDTETPIQNRKEALQSIGYPSIVTTPENQTLPFDKPHVPFGKNKLYLVVIISQLQKHLYNHLSNKDFYLLEDLKDTFLRFSTDEFGITSSKFNLCIDAFLDKLQYSNNYKFLFLFINRLRDLFLFKKENIYAKDCFTDETLSIDTAKQDFNNLLNSTCSHNIEQKNTQRTISDNKFFNHQYNNSTKNDFSVNSNDSNLISANKPV